MRGSRGVYHLLQYCTGYSCRSVSFIPRSQSEKKLRLRCETDSFTPCASPVPLQTTQQVTTHIGEQYRSFSSSYRARRARRHSAISIMQAQADWRRQACGQESGGGSKGARPPPTRCRSAQGAHEPRRDGGRQLLGVCARGKKRCVG